MKRARSFPEKYNVEGNVREVEECSISIRTDTVDLKRYGVEEEWVAASCLSG